MIKNEEGEFLIYVESCKKLSVITGLSATLLLAACGGSGGDEGTTDEGADSGANGDVNYGEQMNYQITGIEAGAGVF